MERVYVNEYWRCISTPYCFRSYMYTVFYAMFQWLFRITYLQFYESQQMHVTERKNAFTERWITFYTCILYVPKDFRMSMISYDVFDPVFESIFAAWCKSLAANDHSINDINALRLMSQWWPKNPVTTLCCHRSKLGRIILSFSNGNHFIILKFTDKIRDKSP